MAVTILLLDDHPLIVNGLASFLSDIPHYDVVARMTSPADALLFLQTHSVDVLVSDMHFEADDLNGVAVMLRIREQHPALKVVFYTMIEKSADVREAILAGARGYVLKKYDADEVGRAIETVLRPNGQYYSPELVPILAQMTAATTDEQPNPLRALSGREKQVMVLIAQELTTGMIAERLSLAESTVHSHRNNLMTKLGVSSNVGIAHFAFKYGLLN